MNDPRQEALERAGRQMVESIKRLNKAVTNALEQYRNVFESVAEAFPGWASGVNGWTDNEKQPEVLTRDEAFAGLNRSRKKGKTRKWNA
jgi:hypothetical protein